MKTAHPIPLILLALAAVTPAVAKPSSSKTPADWKTVAKTNEGKPITLAVVEIGDIGLVATDASYAVLPVTPANADNRGMPEIPVLMTPDKIEAFIKASAPVKTGGRGAFGAKIKYASFSGTFVTLAGEPAIVVGDVKPEMKLKKPSEILAAQLAVAAEAEKEAGAKDAGKPGKKSAPEKKKKH